LRVVLSNFDLALNLSDGKDSNANATYADNHQSYVWGIFWYKETLEIALKFTLGPLALYGGCILLYCAEGMAGWKRRISNVVGFALIAAGMVGMFLPVYWQDACEQYNDCQPSQYHLKIVPQKHLTRPHFWGTVIT
jgi:hypothetical protein